MNLGLGIATAMLDGKHTKPGDHSTKDVDSPWDDTYMFQVISHATKAAITTWPIVFAAILAQTLRAIATYQVERGIRLIVRIKLS